jgi:predicted PurR-regulated permease PerM
MENNIKLTKFPAYSKLTQIILGITAFFFILYIGQAIIIPIIFATLIGILLNPIVNKLTSYKIPRIAAIIISILLSMMVMSTLLYMISNQVMNFTETFPQFKSKFNWLSHEMIQWCSHTFNISTVQIKKWISQKEISLMEATTPVIGYSLGVLVSFIFLLPVYVFMILYYKPLFLEFIARMFPKEKHNMVVEVLVETKSLITSYLIGLLIEAAIIAALNSIGLLIIGIQYAILIGILGALLNMIPYIGGLIALAIPMLIAFTTESYIDSIYVLIVYIVIQFIDNNIIVPRIVASKVQLNALISIVVVLIWGALWGIPGMFLAIPLTAIMKVVFDRIPEMQPFGFLLGDNQPKIGKLIFDFNTYVYSRSKSKN